MQIILCIGILFLSILVYYIFGKAVNARFRWDMLLPEMVCLGFFIYHGLFQVIAEIMIFSKQKLHVLGIVWLAALIFLVAVAFFALRQENRKYVGNTPRTLSGKTRFFVLLMLAAVFCECAVAVLMQRNIGWDFAYYIGNMTTSVNTDTMYLYDGSSGKLLNKLDMRYALSSFYMNTAWISQMTGISALVLQKYVVGVLCVLLTNAIVYTFAMEAFQRDRKKAAILVTITVILTVFWDVYDTSAQFLMIRGYEAKAYCANVVLPMVLYLLYRIWIEDGSAENWAKLFIVAFASVAVSMSSLVLVPALIVVMLLAHLIVARRWNLRLLRNALYCLAPNLCYFLLYFSYAQGWLVVEV